MELNVIDIVVASVVGLSLLIGLFRGLVRELLSLTVWLISIWAGIFHNQTVAVHLEFIDTPIIRNAVAGFALSFSIIILGAIVNFFIAKIFKFADLGFIDKLFGLVFGTVRGLVIVVAVVWLCTFTPATEYETWHSSKLIPSLTKLIDYIKEKIPEEWYESALSHLE